MHRGRRRGECLYCNVINRKTVCIVMPLCDCNRKTLNASQVVVTQSLPRHWFARSPLTCWSFANSRWTSNYSNHSKTKVVVAFSALMTVCIFLLLSGSLLAVESSIHWKQKKLFNFMNTIMNNVSHVDIHLRTCNSILFAPWQWQWLHLRTTLVLYADVLLNLRRRRNLLLFSDSRTLGPFNVFILLNGWIFFAWCVRLSRL